jgi:hypothetical protein
MIWQTNSPGLRMRFTANETVIQGDKQDLNP